MKKFTFETLIKISIEKGKKEKIIYENGLDLTNFFDDYFKINSILLCSIYGEDVSDLISDFILDSVYDDIEKNKNQYLIYDIDSEDIIADCSTLDGLYEFAEKTRLELIESNFSYDIKPPMTDDERLEMLKTIFS